MKQADIKNWVSYWAAAKMVNFPEIGTIEDMEEARRFCSVMRVGLFATVTTPEMLEALRSVREDEKHEAHEAECRAAAEAVLRERQRARA